MSQTSELVSLDIHLVKESRYIKLKAKQTRAYKLNGCVGSTVLLSVTVVLSVGYGGLAPVHI